MFNTKNIDTSKRIKINSNYGITGCRTFSNFTRDEHTFKLLKIIFYRDNVCNNIMEYRPYTEEINNYVEENIEKFERFILKESFDTFFWLAKNNRIKCTFLLETIEFKQKAIEYAL